MRRDNTLWVERYRPDSLAGFVGNEALKTKIGRFIADADIPHLLFVGRAGVGKTTLAKILTESIPSDVMFLNASDDNNIETVRGKIRSFASTIGMEPLKIIVLDEFDGFSRAGQEALRNLMERYSNTTRFILTANYQERISDPIVSRVQTFHIQSLSVKDVCIHVAKILKTEAVEYNPTDIKFMVDTYYPDIRKIINELQFHTTDNKLTLNTNDIAATDIKFTIVQTIASAKQKGRSKAFTEIRQLVANTHLRDFSDIYRVLYDQADKLTTDSTKIPDAIVIIAEGQYRDSAVVDKEINAMSTIIQLLQLLS